MLTGSGANWTKLGYKGNQRSLQVGEKVNISSLQSKSPTIVNSSTKVIKPSVEQAGNKTNINTRTSIVNKVATNLIQKTVVLLTISALRIFTGEVSLLMLQQALFGDGTLQLFGQNSIVSYTLARSQIMQQRMNQHTKEYLASGRKSMTFIDSISFYGKSNKYDLDLSFAAGAVRYRMTFTTETRTTGFWIFKKSKHVLQLMLLLMTPMILLNIDKG